MYIHGVKYINKKFTIHVLNNYSNTFQADDAHNKPHSPGSKLRNTSGKRRGTML